MFSRSGKATLTVLPLNSEVKQRPVMEKTRHSWQVLSKAQLNKLVAEQAESDAKEDKFRDLDRHGTVKPSYSFSVTSRSKVDYLREKHRQSPSPMKYNPKYSVVQRSARLVKIHNSSHSIGHRSNADEPSGVYDSPPRILNRKATHTSRHHSPTKTFDASLPDIERSQSEVRRAHVFGKIQGPLPFKRQLARKSFLYATKMPHDARFENWNRDPGISTHSKKSPVPKFGRLTGRKGGLSKTENYIQDYSPNKEVLMERLSRGVPEFQKTCGRKDILKATMNLSSVNPYLLEEGYKKQSSYRSSPVVDFDKALPRKGIIDEKRDGEDVLSLFSATSRKSFQRIFSKSRFNNSTNGLNRSLNDSRFEYQ